MTPRSLTPTGTFLATLADEVNQLARGGAHGRLVLVYTLDWYISDELGTPETRYPSTIWPVPIKETDATLLAEAYDRWASDPTL